MADKKKGPQVPVAMKICVSKQLVSNWKNFGRILLEDPDDEFNEVECLLEDIDKSYNSCQEKAYQMLQAWQERKGDNANPNALVKALRKNNLNGTANQVEKMISCPHDDSCHHPAQTPVSTPTEESAKQLPLKAKLTEKELRALNYNRKKLVSRTIGIHWKDLAEMLGYPPGECELFEAKGKGEDEHCRQMLDHWFKKKDSTYGELADTLHTMGEEVLAEKLKEMNSQE